MVPPIDAESNEWLPLHEKFSHVPRNEKKQWIIGQPQLKARLLRCANKIRFYWGVMSGEWVRFLFESLSGQVSDFFNSELAPWLCLPASVYGQPALCFPSSPAGPSAEPTKGSFCGQDDRDSVASAPSSIYELRISH